MASISKTFMNSLHLAPFSKKDVTPTFPRIPNWKRTRSISAMTQTTLAQKAGELISETEKCDNGIIHHHYYLHISLNFPVMRLPNSGFGKLLILPTKFPWGVVVYFLISPKYFETKTENPKNLFHYPSWKENRLKWCALITSLSQLQIAARM